MLYNATHVQARLIFVRSQRYHMPRFSTPSHWIQIKIAFMFIPARLASGVPLQGGKQPKFVCKKFVNKQ